MICRIPVSQKRNPALQSPKTAGKGMKKLADACAMQFHGCTVNSLVWSLPVAPRWPRAPPSSCPPSVASAPPWQRRRTRRSPLPPQNWEKTKINQLTSRTNIDIFLHLEQSSSSPPPSADTLNLRVDSRTPPSAETKLTVVSLLLRQNWFYASPT